jgi:aarF domain-containing kinase
MPKAFIRKLSSLHDSIPPIDAILAKNIIERELQGPIQDYFETIDLDHPIGSASVAQVHQGIWKATSEQVAIKVQNPNSERLMLSDLKNLKKLAGFLQKRDLPFDLLSAVTELEKQITFEFDFHNEARNMNQMHSFISQKFPKALVQVPHSIYVTKRLLVMSFIEGETLSKLADRLQRSKLKKSYEKNLKLKEDVVGLNIGNGIIDLFKAQLKNVKHIAKKNLKRKFANQLLPLLADLWGYQIFQLGSFHADPHPGNICILSPPQASWQNKKSLSYWINNLTSKCKLGIGLYDWGQMKSISNEMLVKFAKMVLAIDATRSTLSSKHNKYSNDLKLATAMEELGIEVRNKTDIESIALMAKNMFDTKLSIGLLSNEAALNPFHQQSVLKRNAVERMPPDLFFLIRSIQLLRGLAVGLGLRDFSIVERWKGYAKDVLSQNR